MFEKFPNVFKSTVTLIFVLALILRLIGIWQTADEIGVEALGSYPVDAKNYVEAAGEIRKDFNFQTQGVIIFGPGYPLFLALAGIILVPNPLVLLIFQAIISALTCSLMMHFVIVLIGKRSLSIIAGLALAVMPQAIYLSSLLLSETLFVFLVLSGIICYLKGIKTGQAGNFIRSAVILTLAAFVRPVGQYIFIVFLAMAVVYAIPAGAKPSRIILKHLKWPVTVSIILIFFSGMWIVRNNGLYGFRFLGFSGPIGMFKISALIRANIEGTTYDKAMVKCDTELKESGIYKTEYHRTYANYTNGLFLSQLRNYPRNSFIVILKNIYHNTYIEWGRPYFLLTFLGLLVMLVSREYRAAMLIILLYLYFALFSGFTLWQGKRIFFPGQVFGLVAISYLFDKTIVVLKQGYIKIKQIQL